MIDKMTERDYLRFSELIKERIGNYHGKIALVGVGYGGENFFEEKLARPFEEIGVDYSYCKIHQSDVDHKGYRPSSIFTKIEPSIEKAILVERTARTGDSLLSAVVHFLKKIRDENLNLSDIYTLVAEDFVDLGHFQVTGTDKYGKRGGRYIFKKILKERLPEHYDELESSEGDDFLKISNIPHLRFDLEYEISEGRRLAAKAAIVALTSGLFFGGGKKDE